jgi:serine O-acetyltransferase
MDAGVTSPSQVPAGLSAIRRDFLHYCKVHGARTLGQKLRLPFEAPSFLALAVYRFGRWVRAPERSAPARVSGGVTYRMLCELIQRASRAYIVPEAEIGEDVWLASHGPIFIGGKVGRGCALLGANTLGRSGPSEARPTLGENVTLGPGTLVVGGVSIPDNTTLGANCVVSRTLPASGVYVGTPLRPVASRAGRRAPVPKEEP